MPRPRPRLRPLRLSGARALVGPARRRDDRRVARRCPRDPHGRARGDRCSSSGRAWAPGSCCSPRSRCGRASTRWWASPRRPTSPRTFSGLASARSSAPTLRQDGVIHLPVRLRRAACPSAWRPGRGRPPAPASSARHLDVPGPVRLLHGTQDADVPWETSRCGSPRRYPGPRRGADAGEGRRPSPVGAPRARAARRDRREPASDVAAPPPEPGDPVRRAHRRRPRAGRSWAIAGRLHDAGAPDRAPRGAELPRLGRRAGSSSGAGTAR